MSADPIADALTFDPLAAAEKVTGASYKEDADTLNLGVGLALLHNERKTSMLRDAEDSYLSMPFAEQLALFADLGFAEVYRETFAGTTGDESYVVLWNPDGLLATCESYSGTHRNTAKVYYNYRHDTGGYPSGLTSSGQMRGDVWVGDHDAREGLRHNLNAMRAEGRFLSTWVARPFLWLLNYAESKGACDYHGINSAKIAQLPEAVRRNITPSTTERAA